MSKLESIEYVSDCCLSELNDAPTFTKKTRWGSTRYNKRCGKCGEYCGSHILHWFDSAGVEIQPIDLVECPEEPEDCAFRWHAAYLEDREHRPELTLRDLGHYNVGTYSSPYYTRGPYWLHLDKLDDGDLKDYWNTTRAEAELVKRKILA
jgi:hypothetical protein